MTSGNLIRNKVIVEGTSLYDKGSFGTLESGNVILNSVEALYLLEKKKLTLDLSVSKLYSKFSKLESKFPERYTVYKDMRKKGYILKSGLKFGADFRVYAKGKRPGKAHANWLLFVTKENDKFSWKNFSGMNRVAHSTRKNILVAIVDGENKISYFEVSWKKV